MHGPMPSQSFDCARGSPCTLKVGGRGLAAGEQILVRSACGDGSTGKIAGPFEGQSSAGSASERSFLLAAAVQARVNIYLACWSRDASYNGPDDGADFRTAKPRDPRHLDAIESGRDCVFESM